MNPVSLPGSVHPSTSLPSVVSTHADSLAAYFLILRYLCLSLFVFICLFVMTTTSLTQQHHLNHKDFLCSVFYYINILGTFIFSLNHVSLNYVVLQGKGIIVDDIDHTFELLFLGITCQSHHIRQKKQHKLLFPVTYSKYASSARMCVPGYSVCARLQCVCVHVPTWGSECECVLLSVSTH